MQFNANGIIRQKPEVEQFLTDHDVDICALCETGLTPTKRLNFPGYSVYRADRPGNGRGTALLVRKKLRHTEYHIDGLNTLETTSIILHANGLDILLVSAYLSPRHTLDPNDIDHIASLNPSFIVLGDLNAKHPLWNIYNPHTNPSGGVLFDYLSRDPSARVVAPSQPTRPYPASSIIDILIFKNIHCPTQTEVVSALNSDHDPVITKAELIPNLATPFNKPREKDYDWARFTQSLNSLIPFNPSCNSPSEIDQDLYSVIMGRVSIHRAKRALPSHASHPTVLDRIP